MTPQKLENLLHQTIPLAKAMAVEVVKASDSLITIKAPFAQNKNIHNTAFAGSIYTTATLTGWSLLTNFLDENNLSGSVVLASADIQYRKPIQGDIIASCSLSSEQQKKLKKNLHTSKTVKLPLALVITDNEQKVVKFTGTFAIV